MTWNFLGNSALITGPEASPGQTRSVRGCSGSSIPTHTPVVLCESAPPCTPSASLWPPALLLMPLRPQHPKPVQREKSREKTIAFLIYTVAIVHVPRRFKKILGLGRKAKQAPRIKATHVCMYIRVSFLTEETQQRLWSPVHHTSRCLRGRARGWPRWGGFTHAHDSQRWRRHKLCSGIRGHSFVRAPTSALSIKILPRMHRLYKTRHKLLFSILLGTWGTKRDEKSSGRQRRQKRQIRVLND